uniref:WD_REPEATS_REGION domain-containing protein n=1 Tax=Rhodnius prolixus TaxID=13249 RepID=T1HB54_RHOPR
MTIFGTFGTIEGLAWYNKRLFSVGLQGSVIEYDLRKHEPKILHTLDTSASKAGTDDGYINIFDIYEDELVYNKLMDKQEGRISCISWDSSGDYLITGSVDTIRVWKVSTGHAIHRLLTGRDMKMKETVVWALAVTDDFTIISGDSRGKLCFWDGNNGVSIATYHSHKAGILSLCLAEDQNIVYCAGVDPLIASYERVKMRGSEELVKWVKSTQRVIHDHDVKCLVTCGNVLYSGGVDGYLAQSSYPPKILIKYPPLLQSPCVALAPKVKYLLLRYPNSVTVWKLNIGKNPIKLIEWRPPTGLRVKSASISANGQWFVCSTADRLRLYSLKIVDHKPKLIKVKIRSKKCLVSHCTVFSTDSKSLVIGTLEGKICVIDLDSPTATVKQIFRPHKENYFNDNLKHIAVSEKADYIAASDLSSTVVVWHNGKYYCTLPVRKCPITSMAIQPGTDYLVLVYSDHQIFEYSLGSMKYTEFSRQLQNYYPNEWLLRNFAVHSIAFDSKNPDLLILSDDSAILVINKQEELTINERKIPRLEASNFLGSPITEGSDSGAGSPTSQIKSAFHIMKRYKHLVYFGALSDDEMVAVEVSPASLKEKLPPSFRKVFGRK